MEPRDPGYIRQPEYSRDLDALAGPDDWQDALLPGDLILCRNETSELTKVIEQLDGFFSHICVYVGGGKVVHSFITGVVEWDLEDFGPAYTSLAWARPAADSATRISVAKWARSQVLPGNASIPFGSVDLGQACVLLARARHRTWRDRLISPDAAGLDLAIERATAILKARGEDETPLPSTCAGFSWRAWNAAASPIVPRIARGTILDNGFLRDPDEGSSLMGMLCDKEPNDSPPADSGSASRSGDLTDADWAKWKAFGVLGFKALPGLAKIFLPLTKFPLHEAVSPGDLWCSPSVEARGFLKPEYRQRAISY